jgi:hypothetical protein
MNEKAINELYKKERDYERSVFGEYKDDPSLSFPSFLIFLEKYVQKAKAAYSGKWDKELPPWLNDCIEYHNGGVAPVEAYAEIIKVMALAGAALETYAVIDFSKWREHSESDALKWKE